MKDIHTLNSALLCTSMGVYSYYAYKFIHNVRLSVEM